MNAHIASPLHAGPARSVRSFLLVTAAAAIAAWFLASVAKLSEETVVISIMVVAFVCSWIATNVRTSDHVAHRVTVVRVRTRAH